MKVLVTGGAGYIGSHAVVELLNEGYEVIIADNFINSKPEVLDNIRQITMKNFQVYTVDLTDYSQTEEIFKENKIDAVIHFASFKAVGESISNPLIYYRNNIDSTLVLCSLMNKYKVRKMIFSSSATVYGNLTQVPVSEEAPTNPINPYGRTKLIIEDFLKDLYEADHSWRITILRYFNPIGAHESGLIGEEPMGIPNNLLPYVAKVAIGELEYVNVFGDDYDTPDGTGIRDYIHVVDLAKGHICALEQLEHQNEVEIFNLGTGMGYSVLEVIKNFEKASGRTIHYEVVDRRPGDVAVCYADTYKAEEKLGWKANKGIEEMCKDAWRYITYTQKIQK